MVMRRSMFPVRGGTGLRKSLDIERAESKHVRKGMMSRAYAPKHQNERPSENTAVLTLLRKRAQRLWAALSAHLSRAHRATSCHLLCMWPSCLRMRAFASAIVRQSRVDEGPRGGEAVEERPELGRDGGERGARE